MVTIPAATHHPAFSVRWMVGEEAIAAIPRYISGSCKMPQAPVKPRIRVVRAGTHGSAKKCVVFADNQPIRWLADRRIRLSLSVTAARMVCHQPFLHDDTRLVR